MPLNFGAIAGGNQTLAHVHACIPIHICHRLLSCPCPAVTDNVLLSAWHAVTVSFVTGHACRELAAQAHAYAIAAWPAFCQLVCMRCRPCCFRPGRFGGAPLLQYNLFVLRQFAGGSSYSKYSLAAATIMISGEQPTKTVSAPVTSLYALCLSGPIFDWKYV